MRFLRNYPWLLGGLATLALNLWIGCSEQPKPPPEQILPTEHEINPKHLDKGTSPDPDAKLEPASDPTTQAKQPHEKTPPATEEDEPPHQETEVVAKTEKQEGYPAANEHDAKPPEDLFAAWPADCQGVLILSGDQKGYIEPCGCAGLENQKGGLKRRDTFVQQVRERGWPVALFDIGEQVRRFGVQPEIKFRKAIQSLEKIGYDAVGFGQNDLQLPAEVLLLLDLPQDRPLFVSANVKNLYAPQAIAPYRVVTVGEKKVAVTHVLGSTYKDRIRNDGLELKPAAEALAEVLPTMQGEADLLVLLANSTFDEAKELAKQFPAFHLVVNSSGADEPPLDMQLIEGTKQTYLVDLGSKGMFVAAIGLFDDAEKPLRYLRVPLDKQFADSEAMKKIFKSYQDELKAIGLEGLGLNIRPHQRGAEFVGSEKCADCHSTAYAIWEKTPHAHATDTLLHLDPPRQFDAECLSCHVTGWELNPGTYVPYLTGYLSEQKSKHLFGNGCENCHGPGSKHVAAESGAVEANEAMLAALREEMRLPLAEAEATCVKCHDPDNSPNFSHEPKFDGDLAGFAEYWKHVEHKGKD